MGFFDDVLASSGTPAQTSAPAVRGGFFDDVLQANAPSRLDNLEAAVTGIPGAVYNAGKSAISSVVDAFNPNSEANKARMAAEKNAPLFDISNEVGDLGRVAKMAAAPVAGVGSVIAAAPKNVISHVYDAASPQFTPAETAKLAQSGVTLPTGEQAADLAFSAVAPARGGLPSVLGPKVAPPAAPVHSGPLGVALSEGQATGELPLIQREQAALRGTSGAAAQSRAQEFANQQTDQVARAKEGIAQSLNPAGQIIAASPQEAGQAVSSGVRGAANVAKANVDAAYETARNLGGEIHAAAFEGLPHQIKGDLTLSAEPVIIDQNTPNAAKMIDYLDQRVGQLSIPNKADPFGAPNAQNITGVSLKGVEQWRKALSTFRGDALASNNAADQRASRAVLDAFDNHIDQAVNGGLFSGDPKAVQAWNTARAAYSDYRKTFTGSSKDAAGSVIEKIIGKGQNPAAIPNDVADFLYGSSGVNPSSLNVSVAYRVKRILGETSPEWSAVKQGLFSRLVEPGEGMTAFGPGKVAQRINRFLNVDGKELSQNLYSPQERALIQQYADLMRQLEIPQAGANWSNTATFTAKALQKIGGTLGMLVGAAVGNHVGLPPLVGEAAGAGTAKMIGKLGDAMQVRTIAKQMPLVRTAVAQYQKALRNYQKAQLPASKTSLGIAGANLARSLEPLGIRIESLGAGVGAVNAPADQNQN